jgi:hypothetical protein
VVRGSNKGHMHHVDAEGGASPFQKKFLWFLRICPHTFALIIGSNLAICLSPPSPYTYYEPYKFS